MIRFINHDTSEYAPSSVSSDPELMEGDENVSLTQTYRNDKEGVSFMYPWDWELEDVNEIDPNAFVSVVSIGMLGTYARVMVLKDIDDGSYFAATKADWEYVFENQDGISDVSITTFIDTELCGYPARKMVLTGKVGVMYVYEYYIYSVGSDVYMVVCVCEEDNFDRYEPVFDAIMDSYTITGSASATGTESSIPSETMDELYFRGVPVGQLLGTSYDDMILILGEPDLSMGMSESYYGDAIISFDMYSGAEAYLCMIESDSLDDFTYSGNSLSNNYDELSQVLGREPDEVSESEYFDSYTMIYKWDHMGSEARLAIDNSVTHDNIAITLICVSWWQ